MGVTQTNLLICAKLHRTNPTFRRVLLLHPRLLSTTPTPQARLRFNPYLLGGAGLEPPPPDNAKGQSRFPPGTRADLPAEEINRILRSHESYLLAPGVERIDVNALASNNPIEDQHFEHLLKKRVLFGVLDGHWDPTCGLVVQHLLPNYIENQLEHEKDIPNALTKAFDKLDADLLDLPRRAIEDFDYLSPSEISTLPLEVRLLARDMIMPALTGSCAVVAHLNGSELYVANTGDSRAVVGSRNKGGTWTAKALTEDHQPSNPKEMERLKREHPGEEKTVAFRPRGSGPLRVIGGMMPSRSFGDAKFKWPLDVQKKIDALIQSLPRGKYMWPTPPYCYTPPYMMATPEIRHHTITSEDHFLVMATDGIFDELSNDEVVRAVGNFLDNNHNNKDAVVDVNAATHLIRVALSQGEGQEGVSRMLSIPGYSRNYRDDMTVQVVFFRGARKGLRERGAPPYVREVRELEGKDRELKV
ncbi:[Pyruvate dehydrogenase [acetyl-transferring]]-phosphatase 1, mitochondrial [Rhizophlyctis rosea]|nr:[Pyruvate dehydrogenase [acetyl-transferring]]-phosphatase 1, mitochondrial [Rhizophlyctis rosea]